jgi:hypothetical protein
MATTGTGASDGGGRGRRDDVVDRVAAVPDTDRVPQPMRVEQRFLSTAELAAGFLDQLSVSMQTLASPEAQEKFVRFRIRLQEDLGQALRSGRLAPLTTVTLPARQSATVFVVCSASASGPGSGRRQR